ncbi:MAG: HAD family phosphatase, partial [Spirochaetales bacterium]|nr:HAD family phosphatase [Spirochaetales bacterium]
MIQAVVFDFGEVICFAPRAEAMENIARCAGVNLQTMRSLMWENRGEYDRGTYTGREYYRWILSKADISCSEAVLDELARLDSEAWTNLNPATLKLMDDVRAAGLKRAILSNMPLDFLNMARGRFPIFTDCDAAVFSCETGSIKPESAIYEKLLAELACGPGETAFFDDMPANVEKARELGIQAFLWKDARGARRDLEAAGV